MCSPRFIGATKRMSKKVRKRRRKEECSFFSDSRAKIETRKQDKNPHVN
jgi:hypothetical protein